MEITILVKITVPDYATPVGAPPRFAERILISELEDALENSEFVENYNVHLSTPDGALTVDLT